MDENTDRSEQQPLVSGRCGGQEREERSSTLTTAATKGKSVAITLPQSKHMKATSRAIKFLSSFDPHRRCQRIPTDRNPTYRNSPRRDTFAEASDLDRQ